MRRLRLVLHPHPQSFIDAAMPLLDRHRAGYSGLLAWARALGADAQPNLDALLATVEEESRTVAVGLQRAPGPLVIGDSDPHAAAFMARALGRDDADLPGVFGGLPSCEAFARAWHTTTGHAHRHRFHLRSYALGASIPAMRAPGRVRRARESETDLMADWMVAFVTEAGVPDDIARVRASTIRRIDAGLLWLWDDHGARSLVGIARVDVATVRVAPVYTPRAHRGRGYAGALVAAVMRRLRKEGTTAIYLSADMANPVSNRLYLRVGFVPAGDQYHFDFINPPSEAA